MLLFCGVNLGSALQVLATRFVWLAPFSLISLFAVCPQLVGGFNLKKVLVRNSGPQWERSSRQHGLWIRAAWCGHHCVSLRSCRFHVVEPALCAERSSTYCKSSCQLEFSAVPVRGRPGTCVVLRPWCNRQACFPRKRRIPAMLVPSTAPPRKIVEAHHRRR